MKFVLASASPRRKDILEKFGFEFDIIPCDMEEMVVENESPQKTVERLAGQKAKYVFEKCGKLTLGADTIVVFEHRILGKPKSHVQAAEMLRMLSGKTHQVFTGFAIISKEKQIVSVDCSEVTFNTIPETTIKEYVSLGLGMDKAGGYGVQDEYGFVKKIEGSYYNVMGLPIEKIEVILRGLLDEI